MKDYGLAGKVALVTGAGRGMGEAIPKAFAAEGAKVIVAEIDAPSGRAVVEAIQAAGGEAGFVQRRAVVTFASDRPGVVERSEATQTQGHIVAFPKHDARPIQVGSGTHRRLVEVVNSRGGYQWLHAEKLFP